MVQQYEKDCKNYCEKIVENEKRKNKADLGKIESNLMVYMQGQKVDTDLSREK